MIKKIKKSIWAVLLVALVAVGFGGSAIGTEAVYAASAAETVGIHLNDDVKVEMTAFSGSTFQPEMYYKDKTNGRILYCTEPGVLNANGSKTVVDGSKYFTQSEIDDIALGIHFIKTSWPGNEGRMHLYSQMWVWNSMSSGNALFHGKRPVYTKVPYATYETDIAKVRTWVNANKSRYTCKAYVYTDGSNQVLAGFEAVLKPAYAKIIKKSTDKKLSDSLGLSLKGARYEVFNSSGVSAAVLTTDGAGSSTAVVLPEGAYTVKETAAPFGFRLDKKTYTVTLTAGRTAVVETADAPVSPTLKTRARDEGTSSQVSEFAEKAAAKDTVNFTGLLKGRTYKIVGSAVDAATGEKCLDADGKEIKSEVTFRPEEAENAKVDEKNGSSVSGKVELSFELAPAVNEGRSIVFCEYLYEIVSEGKEMLLASHDDLEDSDQTIHFMELRTTLTDDVTGCHEGSYTGDGSLTDTVEYHNAVPGHTYEVKGELYFTDIGEPVTDTNGEPVSSSITFTPDSSDGKVEIVFEHIDTRALAGRRVVAFETAYKDDVKVASHADIEDREQSVDFAKIGTSAYDAGSGTGTAVPGECVSIEDSVKYSGLSEGKEYAIRGVLYDSASGEPVKDKEGSEIKGEAAFTAEDSDGKITVPFTFDSKNWDGRKVVVFEDLYLINKETGEESLIASEHDINNRNQSVTFEAPPKENPKKSTPPATGDRSKLGKYIGAAAICLAAAVIVVTGRKSSRD